MRTRTALITLLAASSLLAACNKAPDQPPENRQADEVPKPVAPAPKPVAKPAPAPDAKPETAKVKAAPEPTADQQMIDDADATGMTSHTSRDSDAANGANSD